MKRTGAWLTRYALESIGVTHVFGIPGAHTTEIFYTLDHSEKITPCRVTHESSAAFMAVAVSKTSPSIGVLLLTAEPRTMDMVSGICEAFIGGIPILIIVGSPNRTTSSPHPQCRQIDYQTLLAPMTKQQYQVEHQDTILSTIFDAYKLANDGVPGPVLIDIPLDIQLGQAEEKLDHVQIVNIKSKDTDNHQATVINDLELAAKLLLTAKNPGIVVGWGGNSSSNILTTLASHLSAPVATTFQGLSAFPHSHPLHVGVGFGSTAVPAAQNAFNGCDCLLAIATHSSEMMDSFSNTTPPKNLIYIDKNLVECPPSLSPTLTFEGNVNDLLSSLLDKLICLQPKPRPNVALLKKISADKKEHQQQWLKHKSDKVNPLRLFLSLQEKLPSNSFIVCDQGNHALLTAELLPAQKIGSFISLSSSDTVGFCIPTMAALKLRYPESCVVGIVGDGAMLRSGIEALTANKYGLGIVYFLFNDGDLAQISQTQKLLHQHDACSQLENIDWISLSQALGCEYVALEDDSQIELALKTAFRLIVENKPVLVDVHIDYSKQSAFMKGMMKTHYKNLDTNTKARYLARSITQKFISG